ISPCASGVFQGPGHPHEPRGHPGTLDPAQRARRDRVLRRERPMKRRGHPVPIPKKAGTPMRFTLVYDGPLKANASCEAKHDIRLVFHRQLAELWRRAPLSRLQFLLDEQQSMVRGGAHCLLREVGSFRFAPLVTAAYLGMVDLDLTILRLGPVGSII